MTMMMVMMMTNNYMTTTMMTTMIIFYDDVDKQLNDYLSANNLIPSVQSAYRKFHSTESAVLKILSDIYAAADDKMITLLGQLDLSAAFDTVDHQILFDRLLYEYGLDGLVLG